MRWRPSRNACSIPSKRALLPRTGKRKPLKQRLARPRGLELKARAACLHLRTHGKKPPETYLGCVQYAGYRTIKDIAALLRVVALARAPVCLRADSMTEYASSVPELQLPEPAAIPPKTLALFFTIYESLSARKWNTSGSSLRISFCTARMQAKTTGG